MKKIRSTQVYYAIYKSKEFVLVKNDEDKTSEWILFASDYYNNKESGKECNFIKVENRYYLPITPSQVGCAYRIKNFCECLGDVLKCGYDDEKQEFTFDMRSESKEICEKHGLSHAWERSNVSRGIEDVDLWFVAPDSEILNVWEIHEPIKDFPFKGPEKVWVKKDGVWLR